MYEYLKPLFYPLFILQKGGRWPNTSQKTEPQTTHHPPENHIANNNNFRTILKEPFERLYVPKIWRKVTFVIAITIPTISIAVE